MTNFGFYLVITNPVVGYARCAEAAVRAGVKIIQLRMKHASREDIVREAREMRSVTAGTDTLFIVNDDPSIAAEVGAEDRKSTRLNSSHTDSSRLPSSA